MRLSSFLPTPLFRLWLLVLSSSLPLSKGHAQEGYTPQTSIRIGAYTVNSGLLVGIERPYRVKQIEKIKAKRTKNVYRERYWGFNAGFYHHRMLHTNAHLTTEWVSRRQKQNGFYRELSLGIGAARTFVDGATFEVDEQGEVTQVPTAGNFFALTTLGVGVGYNMDLKYQVPLKFYLKPSAMVIYPHNAFFYARPMLEVGCLVAGDRLWQASPRHSLKTKGRRR